MKFRKNYTHEFCVTNALGLGADCLHKVPLFGFVAFCRKTHSIPDLSIAVRASRSKFLLCFSRS